MVSRDVGAVLDRGASDVPATVRWGYALAVVPVAFAAAYWLLAVATSLSFTTRAALLFGLVVALAAVGETATGGPTTVGSSVAAIGTFAAFAKLAVVGHGLGRLGQLVVLAGPPAALLAARSAERRTDVRVVPRVALVTLGVLAVGSVALVGADVAGAGVAYDLSVADDVEVEPGSDPPTVVREVGVLTVTNPFSLPRAPQLPTVHGCVVGDDRGLVREQRLSYQYPSTYDGDALPGRSERRLDVQVTLDLSTDAEAFDLAVERGSDCHAEREQPTLLVWLGGAGPDR